MRIILGSGPAGISAAYALLARGCEVTMLDVGITPKIGDANSIKLKDPLKLSHGSNYPYAEVRNHFEIVEDEKVSCLSSFAQGGLSNVWGGFSEFYNPDKLQDWPIKFSDLQPHYLAIEAILNPTKNYRSSSQAQSLLTKWQKNQTALRDCGFSFGKPSLAVKFESCTYCGKCQHGCPHDLIYSSRQNLPDLIANKNFTYVENCVVKKLKENAAEVELEAYDLSTKTPLNFKAKQVFVACGPIISTKLVSRINEEITFQDSTHFLLPCLTPKRNTGVSREALHTLTQLYLKLQNPEISAQEINLQLYTFMDHYPLKWLPILAERFVAIQGHLDSKNSHAFSMRVDESEKIYLKELSNPHTTKIIKKISNHLLQNGFKLGFLPLTPTLSISKIGRSFHYGASLPMGKKTDIFGKPHDLNRIHVIDASIFPSIPAGSITPTIMANAHRIASKCSLND